MTFRRRTARHQVCGVLLASSLRVPSAGIVTHQLNVKSFLNNGL
jgi:hypothetical protein